VGFLVGVEVGLRVGACEQNIVIDPTVSISITSMHTKLEDYKSLHSLVCQLVPVRYNNVIVVCENLPFSF
jgi:hypothetical protein